MWITKFELSRCVTIFGGMENISGIKTQKRKEHFGIKTQIGTLESQFCCIAELQRQHQSL